MTQTASLDKNQKSTLSLVRVDHPAFSKLTAGIFASGTITGTLITAFPAFFPTDAEARGAS